ncbi:family 16 glycosylhydrolase [Thermotoga sp. Ku-13t]|uniref:family 16 glycosylhydrolase n=1 Tax=Thermotoga sp. Ku-13t TaxID=1755813 RepID=UPI001F493E01|nr:family 16 glycosylhydrolase [Thermotoga sp. Ku-13t]
MHIVRRAFLVLALMCFLISCGLGQSQQTPDGNILHNGDFSQSILYISESYPEIPTGDFDTQGTWLFRTGDGAQAVGVVENGVLKVSITYAGPNSWSVQVLQSPITVEYLGIYRVEFEAWASKNRRIGVKIGATALKGWIPYNPPPSGRPVDQSGGYAIDITTERRTYSFEFTMRNETDDRARFEFQLGQDDGTVYIDNVKLVKIGQAEPPAPPPALGEKYWYELVWKENFDGDIINENVWSLEVGNGHAQGIPGWGNAELEYYKKENAYVENRVLVIEAKKETAQDEYGTYSYTSARMKTQGKFSVKFGRIEFRAKLPRGKGIWPALWMLGENITEVGWPTCGEIDVMEYLGHETNKVYGTIHGPGYSGAGGKGGSYTLSTGDFTEDFHIFAVEWDPLGIKWYVDDVKFSQITRTEVPGDWVFDHPFFIIMNVAVGGYWPGYPDETTTFPQKMYVDYIRVYKGVSMETIDNGSFDYPLTNDQQNWPDDWFLWYGSPCGMGGRASVSIETEEKNRFAVVEVTDTGWESWHVQFNQWVGLSKGKTYRLTFKARAENPRDINVKFLHPTNYTLYAVQNYDLTMDWQTFELVFTFNADYPVANLSIELGKTNNPRTGKVYFDDFALEEAR